MSLLFDKDMRESCELGQSKQLVLVTDGTNETYSSLERRPDVWRPRKEDSLRLNTSVGFSNLGGPLQLISVTRKRVPIAEWGKVRFGYLKGIPITRRNILSYVANKLGGVHYDSSRLPASESDKAERKILAQAYDWEKQAIMHAGLTAVAIASIEIVMHPQIRDLLTVLQKFENERRARLLRGESPERGELQVANCQASKT